MAFVNLLLGMHVLNQIVLLSNTNYFVLVICVIYQIFTQIITL